MVGAWLIRIARALLHEDTFELMVAPAIADLQCAPSASGYSAAWASLAGALGEDVGGDLRYLADDIGMLMTLIIIQASYYSGMLLLLVAGMTTDQMVASLEGGGMRSLSAALLFVFTLSALPTMFCFWPPRRARGHED
jgi:hypothetical protein